MFGSSNKNSDLQPQEFDDFEFKKGLTVTLGENTLKLDNHGRWNLGKISRHCNLILILNKIVEFLTF